MERRLARMQNLVRAVREVRNRYTVDPKANLDVFVRCTPEIAEDFKLLAPFITSLAGAARLECGPDVTKPPQAAGHVEGEFEVNVSLKGLIDVTGEIKRLEKQIAEKRKSLAGTQGKLANAGFLAKASPEVVQQTRDQAAGMENQIQTLEENLRDLKGE